MKVSQVIFAVFASSRLSYAANQSDYIRSKDHGEYDEKGHEESVHGKDILNWRQNTTKQQIDRERRLSDIHALPENIEGIRDSHPDVYQRIIDYSPVFDFDGDSCLPAAVFTCDNSNNCVQNQGLPVGNSYGMTEGCRNSNFMNFSNTYHRWNRYKGRDTWEFHMFALYFEKDQTNVGSCSVPFCDICCGHRHELEQVLLVFKNEQPYWVFVSGHGVYKEEDWSSIPKLGKHPKVVYHSDHEGFNTHGFRFAKSGENFAENPTGKWVTPPMLSWNKMSESTKAFLNTHDYVGNNMKINDELFCLETEKGMNGIFQGETFGEFEFPSYCEGYNRGYFSEEDGGLSSFVQGPIEKVFCSGRYCDNMALQAKALPLDDIDYNQGGWTAWFSEEGSGKVSCPSNAFVVRAQCSGRYCDNLRLYCVPFAEDGEYGFTPDISTKQSGWFSEEGGSGSCGNGW
mmetsp:Transcript_24055/g.35801  ORF Transcript_24055/g.35801 Transcript_24055/m.35801 type:complete len:456 (+) Transcript_24055:389-1756(+)